MMINNTSKKKFTYSAIFLFVVLILGVGFEIYTSKYITDQSNKIRINLKNKANFTQAQKQGEQNEAIYLTAIDKVMSEKEYQDFKNGLSIIAVNSAISINKISDGLVRNIKEYRENKIMIEAVGSYESFKKFKDKLSKLNYFINFDKETISRENASSNKIKINAEIHVIVLANKEMVINELKKNKLR